MRVEPECLELGHQRVILVYMAPTRLNNAHGRVLKPGKGLLDEILRGNKVGVENDNELPPGFLKPFLQRSGLKSGPRIAPYLFNVEFEFLKPLKFLIDDAGCFIRRIIEDLYLQFFTRVVEMHDSVE